MQKSESLITFATDRPGHDNRYAINAEKIKNELDWEPAIKWDEGFEQTIDWYLQNESWWRPLIKTGMFGQRLGTKAKA